MLKIWKVVGLRVTYMCAWCGNVLILMIHGGANAGDYALLQ